MQLTDLGTYARHPSVRTVHPSKGLLMVGNSARTIRVAAGAAAAALALALAGCGGGASPTATAPADPAAAPASDENAQVAEFCEAIVDIDSTGAGGPEVDFETASPEEIQAALAEFGAMFEPLIVRAEESAPDEVREDVTTLAAASREVFSTGEFAAFETPEATMADDNIDSYMIDECGYEQIEVTAADFEYQGLPDTITPGTVAVTLVNEGEELHEIGIARVNDGVELPIEEILALPEEEAMQNVEFKGAAFAAPGESDTVFLRLDQPGRYGALCFIPEGTTSEETEGTGPPHFTLGMVGEFTAE